MAEGENVVLWKFGAFKSAQTKEKQRYMHGNEYISAPHIRVAFKPSRTLIRRVNGQEDKTEEYDEEETGWWEI